jgi:hypothetical protein
LTTHPPRMQHPTMSQVELIVRGSMGEHLPTAAVELRVTGCADGATTLTAEFEDQAQLYGIIDSLRDYGVELMAVRCDVGGVGRR